MILYKPTFSAFRDPLTGAVQLFDGLPAIHTNGELRFVDTDGSERVVPPSFKGNGGSVPSVLRWLIHPHTESAIHAFHLHDHDYDDPAVSRYSADRRLFYTLRCLGNGLAVSFLVWAAVRIGGGSHRPCAGHAEWSFNQLLRTARRWWALGVKYYPAIRALIRHFTSNPR